MNIENPITKTIYAIFSKLIKCEQITQYRIIGAVFDSNKNVYRLYAEVLLRKTNKYKVDIMLDMSFEESELNTNIYKHIHSRMIFLEMSYITLVDDTQSVIVILKKSFNNIRKGEVHERLFYNRFLEPLQKRYPAIIISAIKAPENIDQHLGIDFITTFTKDGVNEYQVYFNIKSSDRFLKEHQEKYPEVGTFIFTEESLKNMKRLQKRFFHFLFHSAYKTVHY